VERTRKCLERLQTDTVDCVMIHGAPDVETLKTPGFHEAMDELKSEGRVRFLGACNHGTRWADTIEPAMDTFLLAAAEDGRTNLTVGTGGQAAIRTPLALARMRRDHDVTERQGCYNRA
jgi:aryl-alcohol dehydrogenase-like predicted oxidoreductase